MKKQVISSMKLQYLGDVNDFTKYCLLRYIADGGRVRIGVCWMLTPDDFGPDGRKTTYLQNPKHWRDHDPSLFDFLALIAGRPERKQLHYIEREKIIPGAVYFPEYVPDEKAAREDYMRSALSTVSDAALIFFDPDNGIEISSKPKGYKNSSKYLYLDEIAAASRIGHSILIYQHFPREKRDVFILRLARKLMEITHVNGIWALATSHVVFLLASRHSDLDRSIRDLSGRFGMKVEHHERERFGQNIT